jgi:N-acetylmuramoyl-L-alanine amidase
MENLYVGSSGENVKKLQQNYKRWIFITKKCDGLYGQGVEQAVREFQYSQGFAIDGVAGISTLIALGLMTVEPESIE